MMNLMIGFRTWVAKLRLHSVHETHIHWFEYGWMKVKLSVWMIKKTTWVDDFSQWWYETYVAEKIKHEQWLNRYVWQFTKTLKSTESKTKNWTTVFRVRVQAPDSLWKDLKFSPDVILFFCHALSVMFEKTSFTYSATGFLYWYKTPAN